MRLNIDPVVYKACSFIAVGPLPATNTIFVFLRGLSDPNYYVDPTLIALG